MSYNVEELKNTWQLPDRLSKNIIDNIFHIASKYTDKILYEYLSFKEKNSKLLESEYYDFNIIELISEKYYKENFHSDIIAKLLENKVVLKNFLEFIEVDNNSYLESVEVTREQYRIDILIKTETNCIIIENKLNYANDQENQLAKYYNACIDHGLKIDKIIYLSPNKDKLPTENSKQNIQENLIKVIYGYNGEGNDFYTQVIKKSFDNFNHTTKKEWIVLAEHYLKVLKQTGVTKMDKLSIDFYEEIVKNPEEYDKIKDIVDIYNNLCKSRNEKIIEKFNFERVPKYNHISTRNFTNTKQDINYTIKIMNFNDNSIFYIYTEDNSKYNEYIIKWLTRYNLYKNFELEQYEGDSFIKRIFKFPEEENELYSFIEELIKHLENDIDNIYN